jgi:hypothetical protein
MSVKKFKFVSPGVFTKEIDNSQLPAAETPAGPVIIGRTLKGPGMKPVKIDSYDQFIQVFGDPVSGKRLGDVWREGNYQGPTYGAFAAQAYLAADVDSINFVRLLGYKDADAAAGGYAGWETTKSPARDVLANGGAYGLFVMPSASGGSITGSLAAVFYCNSGSAIILSGTSAGTTTSATASAGALVNQINTLEFRAMVIAGGESHVTNDKLTTNFNFNKSSQKFIRNVFNTNPQTVGGIIPSASLQQGAADYWLGETFEADVLSRYSNADGQKYFGMILPLTGKNEYRQDARAAHTGWFFSQDLSTNHVDYTYAGMQKLFRIHALSPGSKIQEDIKISIQDLRYSRDTSGADPFGSFSVVVRKADDTDNVVEILERFSNCTLNPNSDNYIGRKIGTMTTSWDDTQRILKSQGNYINKSNYIRVEMNAEVENGGLPDSRMLPFGVYGASKYLGTHMSSSGVTPVGDGSSIIAGASSVPFAPASGSHAPVTIMNTGSLSSDTALLLEFPSAATRLSSSAGGISDPKNAYFGLNVSSYMELVKSTSAKENRADPGYGDYIFTLNDDIGTADLPTDSKLTQQWAFSLDELTTSGSQVVFWVAGNRANGASMTASGSLGWKSPIDSGYTKFTAPLYNGFDGLDIKEIDPFRNTLISGETAKENYAANSIRRAIDTVADPEFVDMNLISMPGLTDASLTEHMIQVCEDRGDSMAVIDIPDVYTPFPESTAAYQSFANRLGSVSTAVKELENRQINSSYGCTYYPWVQIRDTLSGNLLWVPPSVVALGTFASSQASSEVWFAPAGFNRGGLTEGSAGLPVISVTEKLTSQNRDDLYEANINPIASFPNEGIVIFGQKTLQSTPSALDRINVRRMMIFVKKRISEVASGILFDQNVRVTWNRFTAAADPILTSVQNRLGISEYRFILDETTTTPDLVDQNIVYAKVFVKPAKAIEYIAIDFVLTDSGAAFGD